VLEMVSVVVAKGMVKTSKDFISTEKPRKKNCNAESSSKIYWIKSVLGLKKSQKESLRRLAKKAGFQNLKCTLALNKTVNA
jgi:hypothetical protein